MSETSFCWIHQVRERINEDTYQVCRECGHVYRHPADLVAAYNREVMRERNDTRLQAFWEEEGDAPPEPIPLDSPARPAADGILFCQECVHDF